MRTLIALILALFLAACNGSGSSSSVPVDATAIPALRAEVVSLHAEVSAQQAALAKLTLIGKVHGLSAQTEGIGGGSFLPNATNFGPCADMGVLIGFTNDDGKPADALSATGQDFKQCTGYQYAIHVSDGAVATSERIFWDGPNCTGNMITWESGGAGYSTATLQSGVVFASPFDGSILMVKSSQTPQPVLIQSVWVRENPGCQSDVETQLMYEVVPNDTSVTGIPDNGVGKFQLSSP